MNFKFSLNVITMCGFLLLLWRTLVSRRNFYTMYVVVSFELQSSPSSVVFKSKAESDFSDTLQDSYHSLYYAASLYHSLWSHNRT
jgi:hypothetical protein